MKNLFLLFICVGLYGCSTTQIAQAESIGSSIITAVSQGTVVASDAYAVYQAANQQLTSANVIAGKLSVSKVIAGAQAILTQTLGSPATASLSTAANAFVSDINAGIADYKAAGVTSPTAITSAISSSGASTVTVIAALPPTS